MKNNTVSLHRIIKVSPEKLFRAFSEPGAHSNWIAPYGFICEIHQMDFKVGGRFRMSFINFSTGKGHSFGGEYLDIKPNEFIKYGDRFDDPNLPGEINTSVWLNKVSWNRDKSCGEKSKSKILACRN
ncbi:SRPBCC domain-containing protein [Arcticibacter sp. MXS-1]|uniref:SRPBCC domain-containing protein n=1 Tax=Arcticibacter sp. MXS-1 TaxID=3341726 RepID=UPI0035A8BEFE